MNDAWYYRGNDGQTVGPVSKETLLALQARGELSPTDPVWREGMEAWAPFAQVADAPQVPAAASGASGSAAVASLPEGLTGWMAFVGIMTILSGALSILSCFGLPSGVLMIVAGAALFGAKSTLEGLPGIDPALTPFFAKLKTYMVVTGVVFIIGLVVGCLFFFFYFGLIMAVLAEAASG